MTITNTAITTTTTTTTTTRYEGLKTETEIQGSILMRYYYYQLVNVVAAVGLGSVLTNIQTILADPSEIFNILGVSVREYVNT